MTHILPRDPTQRVALRPRSSGSGFDFVRDIIHLVNIIIVVNINNRKTLFTAYALSAQDDSAGSEVRPRRSFYSAGSGVRVTRSYDSARLARPVRS